MDLGEIKRRAEGNLHHRLHDWSRAPHGYKTSCSRCGLSIYAARTRLHVDDALRQTCLPPGAGRSLEEILLECGDKLEGWEGWQYILDLEKVAKAMLEGKHE